MGMASTYDLVVCIWYLIRMKIWLAALVFVCSNAFGVSAGDVRVLLAQGQFSEAHQLALSQPEQMGDPEYDFYLGIAALEAGAPGEAVLALERYILVYPENRNARFNLGRAYFALGEDQHAREEFDALLTSASSEDDTAALLRYLDVIRVRESRYRPVAGFWFDVGTGYDTNANFGNSGLGTIPNLPPPTQPNANDLSLKRADWFTSYSVGAQGNWPLAPGLALFANGSLEGRNYRDPNMDQFDQLNFTTNGGISWLLEQNLFRFGLDALKGRIYNQDFLIKYGLSAEWIHQLGPRDRLNFVLSGGKMQFEDIEVQSVYDKSGVKLNSDVSQRSGDYWGISTAWSHSFDNDWLPVLNLSAGYMREQNTENRPDFTRDLYTALAQISFTPAPGWAMAVGGTYSYADHDGKFGGIPTTVARHDYYQALNILLAYRINRQLSILTELQSAQQNSNIGIYDYLRRVVSTKLRYELQ